MALFWLQFLGCKFVIDPRVATQRFFDSTLSFVNSAVVDATVKGQIYDSVQSEFKSAKMTFSPKKFIEEYIPPDYQKLFSEYLTEEGISLHNSTKTQPTLSDGSASSDTKRRVEQSFQFP